MPCLWNPNDKTSNIKIFTFIGLAIFIKKNIRHELIYTINNSFIGNIGIRVCTQNYFIEIFSCYFPGGTAGSDSLCKQSFSSDIRKLTSISNKYILGGDFNSRQSLLVMSKNNNIGATFFLTNYN